MNTALSEWCYLAQNGLSGHYTAQFRQTTGQSTNVNYRGRFGIVNAPAGTAFEIVNVKLEVGSVATAFTVAPEEIDEHIAEAQTSADEAQTTADDANETAENVRNWMKFTSDGLSMGKDGSTYSTLVDDVGFHVLQSGEKITTIAKRRVAAEEFRVGKLNSDTRCVLREAGDGGIIITPEAF